MTQYNFKVGDRVKFKDEPAHQQYREINGYPNEFVIEDFGDADMGSNTVAYESGWQEGFAANALLYRLELVGSSQSDSIQQAIDTLVKAGYKVTLSKE